MLCTTNIFIFFLVIRFQSLISAIFSAVFMTDWWGKKKKRKKRKSFAKIIFLSSKKSCVKQCERAFYS